MQTFIFEPKVRTESMTLGGGDVRIGVVSVTDNALMRISGGVYRDMWVYLEGSSSNRVLLTLLTIFRVLQKKYLLYWALAKFWVVQDIFQWFKMSRDRLRQLIMYPDVMLPGPVCCMTQRVFIWHLLIWWVSVTSVYIVRCGYVWSW
jgi:hypothetical protein